MSEENITEATEVSEPSVPDQGAVEQSTEIQKQSVEADVSKSATSEPSADAWTKTTNQLKRAKRQLRETREEFDSYKENSTAQSKSFEGANPNVIYDPQTGQNIDMNMSINDYLAITNGTAQNPQATQPIQTQVRQPAQTVKPAAKAAETFTQTAHDQAELAYEQHGQSKILAVFNEVGESGQLTQEMINISADIGTELGENGIAILYDLAKTRNGRAALGDIADKPNRRQQAVALTNLLQGRVNQKRGAYKSNSAQQPKPLNEAGILNNAASTYAERKELARKAREKEIYG